MKEEKKIRILANRNRLRGKQLNDKKTYNPKQVLKDIEYKKIVEGQKELVIKRPLFVQCHLLKNYIRENKKKMAKKKSHGIKIKKIFKKQKNKDIPQNSQKKEVSTGGESKLYLKRILTTSNISDNKKAKYEFCKQKLN